jgi:hypothetical protein
MPLIHNLSESEDDICIATVGVEPLPFEPTITGKMLRGDDIE